MNWGELSLITAAGVNNGVCRVSAPPPHSLYEVDLSFLGVRHLPVVWQRPQLAALLGLGDLRRLSLVFGRLGGGLCCVALRGDVRRQSLVLMFP